MIDLLKTGKVDEVKAILDTEDVVPKEVEWWVYDTSNITLYTVAASMLMDEQTAEMHHLASYLMAMPLCAYNGSFSLGLFHARRSLELDPGEIEYKRYWISFHDIAEQLVKKDEAIKIAREVLQEDPECRISLNVLERYGQKK